MKKDNKDNNKRETDHKSKIRIINQIKRKENKHKRNKYNNVED